MSRVASNQTPIARASEIKGLSPQTHVRVVARTDVGRVRETNEDAFVVCDLSRGQVVDGSGTRVDVGARGVLLAVADGMGGAQAGEVASALVVETLASVLTRTPFHVAPEEALEHAVRETHREVWEASMRAGQHGPRRMGATLTALLVHDDVVTFAQVGDSRAYLIRGGELTQLTRDQSMVQVLMEVGILAPENVPESPYRNVILQAMGHQDQVDVAVGRVELRDRDCLLVCSDGLTNDVADEEIAKVVCSAPGLDEAANGLVALANERGGNDNVTLILAGAAGGLEPAREGEHPTIEILRAWEPKLPR